MRERAPFFDALAAPSAASTNFSASNCGCAHTWHMKANVHASVCAARCCRKHMWLADMGWGGGK